MWAWPGGGPAAPGERNGGERASQPCTGREAYQMFMENSLPAAFGALFPGGGAERISEMMLPEPDPRPGTDHGPPRTGSSPASCRA